MSESTQIMKADGELVDYREQSTALEAITKAEIDVQVSTAKRYPRSMSKFMSEARGMVSLDPDLAAACTFVLKNKRKKTDDGKDAGPVSGPSVRLAEMLAICWGNVRISQRITDDDGKFVTAQAVALDLERNVGYSIEVKRGVTTKDGRRYGDDMIRVTCMAAMSIASRNATFKVVPMAFVSLIEDEARRVAVGDVKTLPERTDAALAWFASKGVPAYKVFAALGISGPADMTLDSLATLHGYRTSIREGHESLDEIFNPRAEPAALATTLPGESKTASVARRLAAKAEPAPQPTAEVKPSGNLFTEPEGKGAYSK